MKYNYNQITFKTIIIAKILDIKLEESMKFKPWKYKLPITSKLIIIIIIILEGVWMNKQAITDPGENSKWYNGWRAGGQRKHIITA